MNSQQSWYPYVGSSALLLAAVLVIITSVLVFTALRFRQPISIKRTSKFLGVALVVIFLLAGITFIIAELTYLLALKQQVGHLTGPKNPITPITVTCAIVTFVVICFLTRRSGFWNAFVSAIVGTIAAPLIFELPFDLIVMWRTYPPKPAVLFTLLFFLPLFIVEISSFAMLSLSPAVKLSKYTLFSLAGMFLVFAVWALFGFAYPSAPIDIAMNMLSKIVAFITAISLFLPLQPSKPSPVTASLAEAKRE